MLREGGYMEFWDRYGVQIMVAVVTFFGLCFVALSVAALLLDSGACR